MSRSPIAGAVSEKHNLNYDLPSTDGLVVDVGGGQNPHPYSDECVDIVDYETVDHVTDIKSLPYDDGEVSGIHCRAVLEHNDPDDVVEIISEFYRILETGGWIWLRVPHALTIGAHGAPGHRSFWTYRSIGYLDGRHRDAEVEVEFEVESKDVQFQWPNILRESLRFRLRGGRIADEMAKLPFVTARVEALLRKP